MNPAWKSIISTKLTVKLTARQIRNFWNKVNKTNSCWIWKAGFCSSGYGKFGTNGKTWRAHKLSFLMNGGILTDEKFYVLHNCPNGDNRLCVNPDHLWAGNPSDNIQDMLKKGRGNFARGENSGMRKHPESIKWGTQHPNAKLTEEKVIKIKKELISHNCRTLKAIADENGIHYVQIGQIRLGRAWAHVKI
jgi:hypothetical protein